MASAAESRQPNGSDSGAPGAEQATEVLAGSIERVPFHIAENGLCVLRIKARGHRELVSVVAHAAEISAGKWVMVFGIWVNIREYGHWYEATAMSFSSSTTAEGIKKFLFDSLCYVPLEAQSEPCFRLPWQPRPSQ